MHSGLRTRLAGLCLLASVVFLQGCAALEGEDKVKNEEKKIQKGMTKTQVEGIFGKPTKIEKAVGGRIAAADNAELYIYQGLDKKYDLWVRFEGDKVSWTDTHDRTAKLEGKLGGG